MKLDDSLTCRGTVRKYATRETAKARKIALKDIANEFGYGNIYTHLLRLPIKIQLKSLPKIEVDSLESLTNKKMIYQSNEPEVSKNYYNYWYNDTNYTINVCFINKKSHRYYSPNYFITKTLYFLLQSLDIKTKLSSDNHFFSKAIIYLDSAELYEKSRKLPSWVAERYSVETFNEYVKLILHNDRYYND